LQRIPGQGRDTKERQERQGRNERKERQDSVSALLFPTSRSDDTDMVTIRNNTTA